MIYVWWSCSTLKPFWISIHTEIMQILDIQTTFTPEWLLLHLNQLKSKALTVLLNNLLVAAKILVAKNWKSQITATINEWRIPCHWLLLMNKLTAIKSAKNGSENALRTFVSIWSKYTVYRDTLMQDVFQIYC